MGTEAPSRVRPAVNCLSSVDGVITPHELERFTARSVSAHAPRATAIRLPRLRAETEKDRYQVVPASHRLPRCRLERAQGSDFTTTGRGRGRPGRRQARCSSAPSTHQFPLASWDPGSSDATASTKAALGWCREDSSAETMQPARSSMGADPGRKPHGRFRKGS